MTPKQEGISTDGPSGECLMLDVASDKLMRALFLVIKRCADGTAVLAQAEDRSLHVLETQVGGFHSWYLGVSVPS